MKCSKCQKEMSLTKISFKEQGRIPGTGGMRRYVGTCHPCRNAIDTTTMPDRIPGEDDDKEVPVTEW